MLLARDLDAQRDIGITPCWSNKNDAAYKLAKDGTSVHADIDGFLCLSWLRSRTADCKSRTAGVTRYAIKAI